MSEINEPLMVSQAGYGCGHATLNPQPKSGQSYRIVMFLDYVGMCPSCETAKKAKAAKRKAREEVMPE